MVELRRPIAILGCLAVLAASASASALARTLPHPGSTERNPSWAGYVVSAGATSFTSVTATWKLPRLACSRDDRGAAVAFWVGLGGSSPGAKALEQTGTAGECGSAGVSAYHGWYQVVPGEPVTTNLAVSPGDTITASVNVVQDGSVALFQLKNRTTRKSFTKRVLLASPPDLSSADWIVEAPTKCAEIVCYPVPLLQFGSVSFSRIAALGNGIGGTLSHPGWTPRNLELVPGTVLVSSPSSEGAKAGAVTSGLSADGRSFEILWAANGRAAAGSV